jgi:DNA-directed RNA polymerase subunit RPC12/RpoP
VARFVDRSRHDWWSTLWKLAIFVGMILVAVVWIYPWRGFLPTAIMILLAIWMYVSLQTRRTGYVCAACGKAFQVPTTVNFFSTSSMGKNPDGTYYSSKKLTCPHCGKVTRARLVKRVGAQEAKGGGRMLK